MRPAALLLLIPLVASLPLSAAVEPPAAPTTTQPAPAATQTFVGKIRTINGVTVSVVKTDADAIANGEKRDFTLTETTKITVDGKEVEGATLKKRLKRLKDGEAITVDLDANGAVVSVEVIGAKKKKKQQ
jgi:uncharacterized protein YuzE